ncbi:hypothetical protein D3C77_656690 [compost metagenome]
MASSMLSIKSPTRRVSRTALANARLGVPSAAESRWRGWARPLASARSGSSQLHTRAIGVTVGSMIRQRRLL